MRALIVDDHWAYRAGLAPLLKKVDEDIGIVEAHDFASAIKALQESKNFDIVLLDLHMPDSEPFAGLKAVRDAAPELPVVVVSVSESRRDVLRALEAGAAGYIPKTAEPDQVLVAITRVLEGDVSIPRSLLERGDDQDSWSPLQSPRGGGGGNPFANLTRRQREVLERLAKGMQNTDIAQDLGLSVFTVKLHVSSIFKALNVSNRTEAARLVLDHGGLQSGTRS